MQPLFQPGNIESNLNLVAAQVALAWVLDQGDPFAAIPGMTKLANLQTTPGATTFSPNKKLDRTP
ncbi:MAG: hypothetical protein KKF12_10475 [Proteobacteria bacterium]|nr:hypothetical protein [Desulfobacula sp.]MBU4131232.1 hypothetical protein [Pseudomonadota bacterium]